MSELIKKNILVVDDEEDVRNFLKTALIESGFDVTVAEDGAEALDRIKEQIPDLISLDLVMPKKSGQNFTGNCQKIKFGPKFLLLS